MNWQHVLEKWVCNSIHNYIQMMINETYYCMKNLKTPNYRLYDLKRKFGSELENTPSQNQKHKVFLFCYHSFLFLIFFVSYYNKRKFETVNANYTVIIKNWSVASVLFNGKLKWKLSCILQLSQNMMKPPSSLSNSPTPKHSQTLSPTALKNKSNEITRLVSIN